MGATPPETCGRASVPATTGLNRLSLPKVYKQGRNRCQMISERRTAVTADVGGVASAESHVGEPTEFPARIC